MAKEQSFDVQVQLFKDEVENLDDKASADLIEKTAVRLEKLNYSPPVMLSLASFLRLTKNTLLEEIERILAMPDQEACALAPDEPKKCEDLRLQFISVEIFYYKKLMLLRQGDPEAWDEVDELYVHD